MSQDDPVFNYKPDVALGKPARPETKPETLKDDLQTKPPEPPEPLTLALSHLLAEMALNEARMKLLIVRREDLAVVLDFVVPRMGTPTLQWPIS